jgi:hypothetical protein
VLRFSRKLVLAVICFGGLVPVRSIRCQPVFVIVRFRWGSLFVGRIGKRIGADECNNRRNKEANQGVSSPRTSKMRFRATESSDAASI